MGETSVQTRVLIVGAGPVGLAAAIELGHRGIPCLLIERNDRVGYAPRAKTTNVRTREHFRRWGIADRVATRCTLNTRSGCRNTLWKRSCVLTPNRYPALTCVSTPN